MVVKAEAYWIGVGVIKPKSFNEDARSGYISGNGMLFEVEVAVVAVVAIVVGLLLISSSFKACRTKEGILLYRCCPRSCCILLLPKAGKGDGKNVRADIDDDIEDNPMIPVICDEDNNMNATTLLPLLLL